MDISNAPNNSIHRSAVSRAIRMHSPSLSPRVDCCYRHESTLFTDSNSVASQVISSAKGVPSARSCSPRRLGSHGGLTLGRYRSLLLFLDDGFCAGSALAVRCFFLALFDGVRRIQLGQDRGHSRVPLRPLIRLQRLPRVLLLPISNF